MALREKDIKEVRNSSETGAERNATVVYLWYTKYNSIYKYYVQIEIQQ